MESTSRGHVFKNAQFFPDLAPVSIQHTQNTRSPESQVDTLLKQRAFRLLAGN